MYYYVCVGTAKITTSPKSYKIYLIQRNTCVLITFNYVGLLTSSPMLIVHRLYEESMCKLNAGSVEF